MGKFLFWVLKKFGWKIDNHPPEGIKQAVIVLGPHTSNWDFVIGNIAFQKYKLNARFLIKKELFFPPLGWLLKVLGGIPINRSKNTNFTDEAVKLFHENEELYLVFTPEGTRKHNANWRKGFYYIAQKANVPIYIGYIDYKKKIGGFHSLFVPTGDVDADIRKIKEILSQFSGRFPKKGIFVESDESK